MPNRYATLDEIRDLAPELLTASKTQFDGQFNRLSDVISRWIDDHTGRVFYPFSEVRFFDGPGRNLHRDSSDPNRSPGAEIYVDDLISVTEVAYSEDDGTTYTALTSSDYDLLAGDDRNPRGSYNNIRLTFNGDLAVWPSGQKAVKVTGVWGKTTPREDAFILTGQTVQDNPLLSGATTLTVTDIDAADGWGITPVISAGDILRIEDEYLEVTVTNTTTNTATIVRGRNGTTAAAHVQTTPVYKWTVHPKIKQACLIQATHQFKRAQGGFADAMALPDMGKLLQIKSIDPEVYDLVDKLIRII
ncbi:MAG: hypothetical protein KAJ07_04785 [Planctomycetes bacterium]|nr:hypothetical protein [Planctomycetota bacterium]